MMAMISLDGYLHSLGMATRGWLGMATQLTLRRYYPAKRLNLDHAGGWEKR